MRTLLAALLVLTLSSADSAFAQSQYRSGNARRQVRPGRYRNTARESRQRKTLGAGARARGPRSGYPQSDWKQRLAEARRMQYPGRSRNGTYRVADGRDPYARDDYYAEPYGGYGGYADPYGFYGPPPVFWTPDDYADVYFNKRYYDDGPNGPGYYNKDRWYNWSIAQRRTDQLHDANSAGVDQGMAYFRAGNYERAAIAWINASTLDQGDAVSRLHAGNALFALGRYDQSVKLLDRAFELAPHLAGAAFDIRLDYGRQGDFERHFRRLEAHVAQNPDNVSALTLMGYILSYTEGPSHAYPYLHRARAIAPKDTFVEKLWNVAATIGPASNIPQVDRQNSNIQPAPRSPVGSSRPGEMKPMTPVPSGQPQGVRQNGEGGSKSQKMHLVSAQNPHR